MPETRHIKIDRAGLIRLLRSRTTSWVSLGKWPAIRLQIVGLKDDELSTLMKTIVEDVERSDFNETPCGDSEAEDEDFNEYPMGDSN